MSNFTRNAIRQSFIKLLSEYPYSQITVKDIVGDCGINRNSFYYHYQDLPALLEEILRDSCDSLIELTVPRETLEDSMIAVMEEVSKNRKLIIHIFKSMDRDVFERYLWKLTDYFVSAYLNRKLGIERLSEEDRLSFYRFYQCEFFGVALGWLESGMSQDVGNMVKRIARVKEGQIDAEIRKFAEGKEE